VDEREQTQAEDFPMPEIDANGVDRSQVRRMLALTPAERMRVLEAALASMIQVRHAAQRPSVSADSTSSR
jgi:hypothetical protein